MKYLFLFVLLLSGCAARVSTYDEYPYYYHGCVETCDGFGDHCSPTCGVHHYYPGGVSYYWSERYHRWEGPHGYWHGGHYYPHGRHGAPPPNARPAGHYHPSHPTHGRRH